MRNRRRRGHRVTLKYGFPPPRPDLGAITKYGLPPTQPQTDEDLEVTVTGRTREEMIEALRKLIEELEAEKAAEEEEQ
jgi:hypothetical protein